LGGVGLCGFRGGSPAIIDRQLSAKAGPLSLARLNTSLEVTITPSGCSARADGAVQDAFFEPAGRDLSAGMLLAAALQHRPTTQVFTWLSEPNNQEPVDILRAWDYNPIAADVQGVIMSPEKQRGGVYGTVILLVVGALCEAFEIIYLVPLFT
jgi:hypothetical protein